MPTITVSRCSYPPPSTHLNTNSYHIEYLSYCSNSRNTPICRTEAAFPKLRKPQEEVDSSHIRKGIQFPAAHGLSRTHTPERPDLNHVGEQNMLPSKTFHLTRPFNPRITKPQDSGVMAFHRCASDVSENRKTAQGLISAIHTPSCEESQYGTGVPPPGCVRVPLLVGTVQYNTTR